MRNIAGVFIITIIYFVFIGKVISFFFADVFLVYSKQQQKNGDINRSLSSINTTIKNNPYEPAYYRQKAKLYIYLTDYAKALENLKYAESLNPTNLATTRNEIPSYYLLGKTEEYIFETVSFYEKLKNTYENDLGIYADIAQYEKRLGLENEFKKTYEKSKNLRPDIVEWHPSFN